MLEFGYFVDAVREGRELHIVICCSFAAVIDGALGISEKAGDALVVWYLVDSA